MYEKPKVFLFKSSQRYNITQQCDGIKWCGDYQSVARRLEIDVLCPVNDKNQKNIIIPQIGDYIALYVDDGAIELFRGFVWSRDTSSSSQFIKITAYDATINLTKSTASYNFKNTTPETTARKICTDFKVPIGNIIYTGISYSDCALGKSPYETIMAGYTEASKVTGKKYMTRLEKGVFNVIEKGSYVVKDVFDDSYNITNTQSNETLDGMINKVIIYDEKGNTVNQVSNDTWLNLYGLLQNAIQADKDKDNMAIARETLKDMDKKCSIEALGNIEAITGNAIKVRANHSNIVGLFYIDADEHSFKSGVYSVSLTLNFQNLMDEKEVGKESTSSDGGE